DVGAGRRGAPGVVDTVTQLDEDLGAREGDSPRLQPGAVEIDLVEQLRDEVAGLGTEDGDGVPGRAVSGVDDQLVAAVRQPLLQGGKQRRQVHGHAGGAELPGRGARSRVAVVVGRGR